MMINRDELIAEVTSSIAARLKVELEAPLKELLTGLKDSWEVRAAQLKDLADDLRKLKLTEDLLEPSSGSIPKIDTDLEVIPTESKSMKPVWKLKFRDTMVIQRFWIIKKVNLSFLVLIFWWIKRAATHEVNDFDALNLHVNDDI
ncbi:hypothetical protein MKW98_011780 [Papaver atlanticum]|uniref:Uncharacterized protein n=1 Tax=Papaver atlanticum TaxID=357466 RepID=A0AAD4SLP5_9MAGN|nr:hypothetical protein MKW98_011780 [Papaver atlanticum]